MNENHYKIAKKCVEDYMKSHNTTDIRTLHQDLHIPIEDLVDIIDDLLREGKCEDTENEYIPPKKCNNWAIIKTCPVCDGRGNVQVGFYEGGPNSDGELRCKCRACDGEGIFIFNKEYKAKSDDIPDTLSPWPWYPSYPWFTEYPNWFPDYDPAEYPYYYDYTTDDGTKVTVNWTINGTTIDPTLNQIQCDAMFDNMLGDSARPLWPKYYDNDDDFDDEDEDDVIYDYDKEYGEDDNYEEDSDEDYDDEFYEDLEDLDEVDDSDEVIPEDVINNV